MKQRRKGRIAMMQPCIRYYPYPVSFPLQLLLLLFTLPRSESVFSISLYLCNNAYIADKIVCWQMLKHILPGKRLKSNIAFTRLVCSLLFTLVTVTWTLCIMMQAGDIHPNPGPATVSTSSISSLASVSSAFNFSKLSNHLSVVHYNVQSLVPKLDLLTTELSEFDILAFTETWLNPSVPTIDLTIDSYRIPERKDRPGDSHGGVILYVKNNIHYTRRQDLELRGVESIWIELTLKHKHILFGVFYRPPNSEAVIFSAIEDSINLAVDSGVNNIIITGDFNLNMQNVQSARKITSLCEQLSLFQSIEEPTHFTETSSSLIDLLLVNNNEHLILSGVGDPFLHQDIRYHCPVFGVFNFRKPKCLSFKRRIWKYDDLLNADLEKIAEWALKWLVKFNPLKTESLLISRKTNTVHPPVFMQDQQIKEVESHKHLGVILSNDCSWQKHIDYIKEKAWTRIKIMRRLKYDLDRKSLETIYKSFIRPLLEYADVIWDNCTQQNKNELELIQLEAARISTGTTKLVSVANLYIETGWETLDARRNKHKLVLFYKMFNDLTPLYLSSLVPPLVQNASRYNLRNSNDTQTVASRTTLFYNSFLPSSIRDWNRLNSDIRNAGTLDAFKFKLNQNLPVIPGIRKNQIWHTRIRTGCSSLKNDLFLKNIIDSPQCTCNSGEVENAYHFFFICQLYNHLRVELRQSIAQYCTMTLDVLLRGDERLSTNINSIIFEAVHKYIQKSKRF